MDQQEFDEINESLKKSQEDSLYSLDDFMKVYNYTSPKYSEDVEVIWQRSQPIRGHLEKYWRETKRHTEKEDYALGCFFALTLIEEAAKAYFMFFSEGRPDRKAIWKKMSKDAFQNHREKYRAMATTFISGNPRTDKLYGIEAKQRFEALSQGKELVDMRHNCLLFHCEEKNVFLPEQLIKLGDAGLVICFCGEIYAEVQEWLGDEGGEFERITAEVAKLRAGLSKGRKNSLSTKLKAIIKPLSSVFS